MKKVFPSFDCINEELISQYKSEIVFWISRHPLGRDQQKAIVDLHGEEVTIIHLNNIDFPSLSRFTNIIDFCSKFGTVYTVPRRVPIDYIEEVCSRKTRPVVFRTFRGYYQGRSNTFKLLGVYEVGPGYNKLILKFRPELALAS